mmetsp:Transcript_9793/g.33226  ORF Transcript_9793/g.33226 Transcript_9793/m.33226 type:complete len:302 (-) Transcript_9793:1108-2013(-)
MPGAGRARALPERRGERAGQLLRERRQGVLRPPPRGLPRAPGAPRGRGRGGGHPGPLRAAGRRPGRSRRAPRRGQRAAVHGAHGGQRPVLPVPRHLHPRAPRRRAPAPRGPRGLGAPRGRTAPLSRARRGDAAQQPLPGLLEGVHPRAAPEGHGGAGGPRALPLLQAHHAPPLRLRGGPHGRAARLLPRARGPAPFPGEALGQHTRVRRAHDPRHHGRAGARRLRRGGALVLQASRGLGVGARRRPPRALRVRLCAVHGQDALRGVQARRGPVGEGRGGHGGGGHTHLRRLHGAPQEGEGR